MALRNIEKIDEDKCYGCGQFVTACAEAAIEIIDGKSKLISDIYIVMASGRSIVA